MSGQLLKKQEKNNPKFDARAIWIGFFITVVLFFLFCLVSAINSSPSFRVKKIKSNIVFEEKLKQWLDKYVLGQQLSKIDIRTIYAQIFKAHPEYKEIYVLREFPDAINIEVRLRRPFAQLKLKGFYLIDRYGVIISDASPEPFKKAVPLEITQGNISAARGNIIKDRRLDFAFGLMEKIRKRPFFKKIPLASINTVSLACASFVIADTRIIIGNGDIEHKLNILEEVIKRQLNNNISLAEYIDLRYQEVVIGRRR
jgi:cell division septal protein FtsQ